MALQKTDIFVALAINLIQMTQYVSGDHILPCNVTSLDTGCSGDNQICNATTAHCDCLEGYELVGEDCESPSNEGPHPTATAPIVTVFALVLIVFGLILVIRKYNLVNYIRQKIIERRNNDVMYEDVMIGNDDPPLSP